MQGVSVVAEPFEPYIGSVCSGLVDEYYVPPSSTVDPMFAPLLPPYVLQSVNEYSISTLETYIPKFLTSKCLVAQRKYICSLAFMKPFASAELMSVLGNEVYLPAYPAHEICTSFVEECSYLIGLAPALGMNCSTLAGGVPLFPTEPVVCMNTLHNHYFMIVSIYI